MRTLRLLGLLFLFSVWLAVPAHAQTTTTTSPPPPTTTTAVSTTTTTTPPPPTTTTIPITVGVCATIEHIQPSAYWMAGAVRGTGNYSTGGMTFASPTSMKAAAACLCHSRFRKPLGVLFGGAGGYTFEYDATNFTILAYTAPGTQVTPATSLSSILIPFVAVCQ